MREPVSLRRTNLAPPGSGTESSQKNMNSVIDDSSNLSLSMKAEYPYPIFDRLPFGLPCSLPFENIFFPSSAFSCTWCGVGYSLAHVAKIEVESNILGFCCLFEVDYIGMPCLSKFPDYLFVVLRLIH